MATKTTEKKAKTTAPKAEKTVKTESSLFAVIKTGGKQYIVKSGDVLKVEKIDPEDIVDNKVTFNEVLLIDDGKTTKVGTPTIAGSKVVAEIVENIREKKVIIIRYRQKSRHFKKNGHRQPKTYVKVVDIK
jgi:large subunit ribosomal protein L21